MKNFNYKLMTQSSHGSWLTIFLNKLMKIKMFKKVISLTWPYFYKLSYYPNTSTYKSPVGVFFKLLPKHYTRKYKERLVNYEKTNKCKKTFLMISLTKFTINEFWKI